MFRGYGFRAPRCARPRNDEARGAFARRLTSLNRHPFLQPLSGIDFAGIEIAARVELGDVHEVKFAGVAPGAAEMAHDRAVLAADGFQHFIAAVDQHEKILLAVERRESEAP